MKKLFALVLLSVLALSGQAFAQKTYVNGIDPNYPPFAYIDEKTGEPAGFDVDSLNWIAKTMGITITHKPMAWDGIIPALQAKQIDMIDSGMSITEERKAQVSFSDPYWHVPTVFVTKKDSKLTPEDVLTKKIKLGIQRGTSEAVAIKKEQKAKKYPFELREYDSAPLAIEDLLNGRIDCAYMDELPADDSIAKGRAVKKIGTHGTPTDFGVAVRKSDTELLKIINEGYKKLMADPYWKPAVRVTVCHAVSFSSYQRPSLHPAGVRGHSCRSRACSQHGALLRTALCHHSGLRTSFFPPSGLCLCLVLPRRSHPCSALPLLRPVHEPASAHGALPHFLHCHGLHQHGLPVADLPRRTGINSFRTA